MCGLRYGGLYRSGVRVNPTPAMGMTTSTLRFPDDFPRPRASRTREREFHTQYMPQEARPLRWRVENTRHGQITFFLDDTMHDVNNVLGHSLSLLLFSYTHEHFCPSNEEYAAWLRGPLQRSSILQTSDEQTNGVVRSMSCSAELIYSNSLVGVAQKCGSPERPELRVLLHGALEVDHENDVSVGPGRVLVAGTLESTLSSEHLPLHLHLLGKAADKVPVKSCCLGRRPNRRIF